MADVAAATQQQQQPQRKSAEGTSGAETSAKDASSGVAAVEKPGDALPEAQSQPQPPAAASTTNGETTTQPPTTDTAPNGAAQGEGKTTPTLEKDIELDFAGNVDVNDDLPSQATLDKVGDLVILDSAGQSRPFKELYSGPGVAPRQLIIFIRHFFCGNCQEYLRSLSASITPDSLLSLPTPTFITIIGCGRPSLIDMYVRETSCPFPVYADPTRRLYDHLGMTRTFDLGRKPEYISSNLLVTSVQSIVQGIKTGNKALQGGDFKQVGGEFLFEGGEVKWVHRMRNTRDHVEVGVVRELLGLEKVEGGSGRGSRSGSLKGAGIRGRASSWGKVVRGASLKDREKDKGVGKKVEPAVKESEGEVVEKV
ncbi:hypothetical protein BU24DRAFT_410819 [Aaosphaeria arxii CBS 175.79]|uniref:AhpC-TSA-domain-containing protein n=1 Tax=Aaosphaeria arxii CBS 175.79 TaxID=1450172 RepID=A0A6A5XQH0_9PLEO|nr:uncharacterized protein BU24DRAFT_410819 [Aaosphaeria arxii CBS 175.79]KAF2015146.1 hypothetical protein BU24DRAFT_410819 [Aaosphaeria arxii CBS 175.79]